MVDLDKETKAVEQETVLDKKVSQRPSDNASMFDWAWWYAVDLGWYIVPLNNPIFDDRGNCIGCTCDEYYIKETGAKNKNCKPGKHPRIGNGWEEKASNNPKTISDWWRKTPNANIGLAVGKSGLVVLDLDSHKPEYTPPKELCDADWETVRAVSGSKGSHLFWKKPEGKAWGNESDELEAQGVDVRCDGGLIVLTPSKYYLGGNYQWELDYGPDEIDLAPCPDWLVKKLDAAQVRVKHRRSVVFSDSPLPKPDLAQWRLPKDVVDAINDEETASDRSERDYWICCALVRAGAGDDDIRAFFEHYSIGQVGKFSERGLEYLTTTITSARKSVGDELEDTGDYLTPDEMKQAFDGLKSGEGESEPEKKTPNLYSPWPYDVRGGQLVELRMVKGNDSEYKEVAFPIGDYYARIVGELHGEDENRFYKLSGEGVRGGAFSCRISAEDFSDTTKLKATLEKAVGPLDSVYAGRASHLGPSIKKLSTPDNIETQKLYTRTGWGVDGRFMIPGREPAGVVIELPKKMAYRFSHSGDIKIGAAALDAAIQAMGPERGTIVVSHALTAPLAKLAGWENERCGLFLSGKSGQKKTSSAQVVLSMYGKGFYEDANLYQFGVMGTTKLALLKNSLHAHSMPFLVDNFKPQVARDGDKELVEIINALMEGGDKERLYADGSGVMESKPNLSWPVFSGEDVPRNDVAAIARILEVRFELDCVNLDKLSIAQKGARDAHLEMIGESWIEWLESTEGAETVKRISEQFDSCRRRWGERIRREDPKAENPDRIATNIAINELAFSIACNHPVIGPVLKPYLIDHTKALGVLAGRMAQSTEGASEANRFLSVLADLWVSGRVKISEIEEASISDYDRDRWVGVHDDKAAYIQPTSAIPLVEKAIGKSLGVSSTQLYNQLYEMGALVDVTWKTKEKGEIKTKLKLKNWKGAKPFQALHINLDLLKHRDPDDEELPI